MAPAATSPPRGLTQRAGLSELEAMRLRVALAFCCGSLWACNTSVTQLVVSIDTDYEVPVELDRVMLTTQHAQEDLRGPHLLAMNTAPVSFGVTPLNGDEARKVRLIFAGHKGASEPVVVRSVETGFRKGKRLLLQVFLDKRCAEVWSTCQPGETCINGACRGDSIDEDDLQVFSPGDDRQRQTPPDAGPPQDMGTPRVDSGLDAGPGDTGDADTGVMDGGDAGPCEVNLSAQPSVMGGVQLPMTPNRALMAGDLDGDGVVELAASRTQNSMVSIVDFEGCAEPVVRSSSINGELERAPLLASSSPAKMYFLQRNGVYAGTYAGALSPLTQESSGEDAEHMAASPTQDFLAASLRRGMWRAVIRNLAAGTETTILTEDRLESPLAHFQGQDFIGCDEERVRLIQSNGDFAELGQEIPNLNSPVTIDGALLNQPSRKYIAARAGAHLVTYRTDLAGKNVSTSSISFGAPLVGEPVPLHFQGEVRIAVMTTAGEVRVCSLSASGDCAVRSDMFSILGAEVPSSAGLITAYVDGDGWPDLIVVTSQGSLHFRSGAQIDQAAAPSVSLPSGEVSRIAAVIPEFWSAFGVSGSMLAVQQGDQLRWVGWQTPAGAPVSTGALWPQWRRDAQKSARMMPDP